MSFIMIFPYPQEPMPVLTQIRERLLYFFINVLLLMFIHTYSFTWWRQKLSYFVGWTESVMNNNLLNLIAMHACFLRQNLAPSTLPFWNLWLTLFLVSIDAELLYIGMRLRVCGMKLIFCLICSFLGFKHWAVYYCSLLNLKLVILLTNWSPYFSKYLWMKRSKKSIDFNNRSSRKYSVIT